MEFLERLFFLINENGVSRSKFLSDIGAGKNSFVYWENHKNLPSGDTLLKIADYFGVSVDYLLGKDAPEPAQMSADETELLALFERVPPERRALVLQMIKIAIDNL